MAKMTGLGQMVGIAAIDREPSQSPVQAGSGDSGEKGSGDLIWSKVGAGQGRGMARFWVWI
jgi:hypothetical protein